MTKTEMFTAIRNSLIEAEQNSFISVDADMIAFIDHEIELLAKRNANRSSKPTKAQIERQAQYDSLVEWLADNANATCAQVAEFMGITLHSATGLLTQLRKAGKVKREYSGKTPVYSLGSEVE